MTVEEILRFISYFQRVQVIHPDTLKPVFDGQAPDVPSMYYGWQVMEIYAIDDVMRIRPIRTRKHR